DLDDLVVNVTHAHVVTVDHAAHGGPVGDGAGMTRKARIFAVVIHADFQRGVRAGHPVVTLDELVVVEPGRERVVDEGVLHVHRHAVGRVRVPIIDVQEPIVGGGVPGHPFVNDGLDDLGRLHAALAGVVDFVEAGVEMPGRVALTEGADHRGVITAELELAGKALLVEEVAKVAPGALDLGLGGGAAVADHAGVDAEAPGIQGGARGQAGRVGGVAVFEHDALPGDPVDGGAGVAMVAVATEVVGTAGVDVDVEDAHGSGVYRESSEDKSRKAATMRTGVGALGSKLMQAAAARIPANSPPGERTTAAARRTPLVLKIVSVAVSRRRAAASRARASRRAIRAVWPSRTPTCTPAFSAGARGANACPRRATASSSVFHVRTKPGRAN